jgi:two-component system sensor histidine kinase CpxA
VRLDELVDAIVDDCSVEAKARGCLLALKNAGPVTLSGDPELLRRAIENILRNAIRYEPAGSAVEVGLTAASSAARISVRDHGLGVPPDALPQIFNPFFRVEADRNRTSGGVGLGLAIARRAVELHKGTLRAENANPGLRVEIMLPVPPSPAPPLT